MSSAFARCSTAEDLLSHCVQVFLHAVQKGRMVDRPAEVTWVNKDARWEDVQQHVLVMCKELFGTEMRSFQFEYLDDSNDAIEIGSQAEWEEALRVSAVTSPDSGLKLHLLVSPAPNGHQAKPKQIKKTASSKMCLQWTETANPAKDETLSGGCCKPSFPQPTTSVGASHFPKPPDCRFTTGCCTKIPEIDISEYKRPLPTEIIPSGPQPKFTGKVVNPTLDTFEYSGEFLRSVTLPLGPIGGGVIAIAGDGGLRQWQVSNRINHNGHVPDSFFAIRVDSEGEPPVAKILQSDALYGNPPSDFVPAPYVTDHVVPEASKKLLEMLPFGVPEIEIMAKYPVVEVAYPNSGLPVAVKLEAFNPCIPFDSKSSAYPAIIFNFSVTNPTDKDVQVTMLSSLQNFAGWDGETIIQDEVMDSNYGGNSNMMLSLRNLAAIDMSNPTLDNYDSTNGHMANAVLTSEGDTVSTMLQFDSVALMWKNFCTNGLPGQGASGPSPKGKTWNGALALTREIKAGATQVITFILAWHFPHRYLNWSQSGFGLADDPKSKSYLGNQYANFWPTITEVLEGIRDNISTLTKHTLDFRDAMYESTSPWQLIDSAAGRVSPVRSPTGMWLGDGRFYAFEGCVNTAGCCPLNCTHVWNYEMSLARLWPDVERTMREVEFTQGQLTPVFQLMSRVSVPLELRRWFSFFYESSYTPGLTTAACVDGELGSILKLYREVRMGAPKDWLSAMWPGAYGVLNRWMTTMDQTVDNQHTGLVACAQPNTYDCSIYGVNTFIGALYLCALRAGEELATLQGNPDFAASCHARYELGAANLDKACFVNGKWYTQVVDEKNPRELLSDSTFIDCLLGQWWGYALELGDILPLEHCQMTCDNVFQNNHRDSFDPAQQYPRKFLTENDSGLYVARWQGETPKNAMLYTSEGAWTGLEHEYAGLCIYQGQIDIAMQVLQNARQRHDGWRRSPWNEIECGDHYSRSMSAFQLFDSASGLHWTRNSFDNTALTVAFKPSIEPYEFQGFYSLTNGWGRFQQKVDQVALTGNASLTVMFGEVSLTELDLPVFDGTGLNVTVTLNGEPQTVTPKQSADIGLVITFAQALSVTPDANGKWGVLSISVEKP